MCRRKYWVFTGLILGMFLGFSQEYPPIIKFTNATYNAGNQNWMIAQDAHHFIYFANNEGLLEYNGSTWRLYKSPNESILRSVKVIGKRIYTGCYMDFGYWTRNTNGNLTYTSLTTKIKSKILDDEQFWNIISYDQWVVFQSLDQLYIYDTQRETFQVLKPNAKILKSFLTGNTIYYQTSDFNLYEIEQGKGKLIASASTLVNNKIVNIFAQNTGLLVHTQFNGFFNLQGNSFVKFNTEADKEIANSSIYSSQQLKDGSFAVGTISNGVYILSPQGSVRFNLTQSKGLCNNTVLSLFEDMGNNLWVGLDNGINCINLNSPVRSYIDETGTLGTVYAAIVFKGNLYLGTNQGLFYKPQNSNIKYQFVSGTKGQVWSLFIHDDTLFCGHDSGTYTIQEGTSKLIFSQSGTWKFSVVPFDKNKLLQGNYYGISVLEKVNNQWQFKNRIQNFNYSARFFEFNSPKEIYVSHEYKGLFRLQIDPSLTKTLDIYSYSRPTKSKNAGLFRYNDGIYYAYKNGIFHLNTHTKAFTKDPVLSEAFQNKEYTSGKITVDAIGKLWLFSRNYINCFASNKINTQLKRTILPIPSRLINPMLGFENISQISSTEYLLGTTDGYYIFDNNVLRLKSHKIALTDVSVNKQNQSSLDVPLQAEGDFSHEDNNVSFNFTVPQYNKYIFTEYQYLLEGFQDDWSEWSTKPSVNFRNLPPGDYVFKVRARITNSLSENTAIYRFSIAKPWYATNLALFFYLIGGIFLFRYINKQYRNYYMRQREKLIEENNRLLEIKELENEQQLMKLRNEQLTQDVDAKSKELAVSTMSLLKKDELLALIKEDLKKSTDEPNSSRSIKSLISTINRNIGEENTWKVFKEAFDTADKDFLKKVKEAHPSLTPNDLRLCAYLRLNLSSKEIAPLLNISVRSIEIKRYRLRKKMNLPHEKGLVEYILSI
jgi:AraC family chitin signaling transcriptional activator